jgi:hypothetical protein
MMEEIQTIPDIEVHLIKKNTKPKNPQYFNEYYHSHKDKVACKFCGTLVVKLRMCRHIKSKSCQLIQSRGCHDVSSDKDSEEEVSKQMTIEERMFTILDKYFETLSQKRI